MASMYREQLALDQQSKVKRSSTSQSNVLCPVHSGLQRRRAVRLHERRLLRPDRSHRHSQNSDYTPSPERSRAESSVVTSWAVDRLSDHETPTGIDLRPDDFILSDNSGHSLPRNLERPVDSSQHFDRSRNFLSARLSSYASRRILRTRRSLLAPNVNQFHEVGPSSRSHHSTLSFLSESPDISNRLSTTLESHPLITRSSFPDSISSHSPDAMDEPPPGQSTNHRRNNSSRSIVLDQLQPRSYERVRRSLTDSHNTRDYDREEVDGLGDRRRSYSPEDDFWATLRTTITPDEHLPSLNSSFTSADISYSSEPSAATAATLQTVEPSEGCFFFHEISNEESEQESHR